MGKLTFAGSQVYFEESAPDYPKSNQSGKDEVLTGVIPPSGTHTRSITNGLSKNVVGVGVLGQLVNDIDATISAAIVNDTTLEVYSSLKDQDPGNNYFVTLQYK